METVDALMLVPLCGMPLGKAEGSIVKAHHICMGECPSPLADAPVHVKGKESGEGVTDPVTGIVLHV